MSAPFLQIFELSVSDRLQLVEELWDSIADSADELPVQDWQKEELDRRKAKHAQPSAGDSSWDDIENRIRSRHAR